MKIDLEVEIPVERFAVLAELAFLERRPELGILCRAARAAGGRITEERVAEILPGLGKGGVRHRQRDHQTRSPKELKQRQHGVISWTSTWRGHGCLANAINLALI